MKLTSSLRTRERDRPKASLKYHSASVLTDMHNPSDTATEATEIRNMLSINHVDAAQLITP